MMFVNSSLFFQGPYDISYQGHGMDQGIDMEGDFAAMMAEERQMLMKEASLAAIRMTRQAMAQLHFGYHNASIPMRRSPQASPQNHHRRTSEDMQDSKRP